MGEAGCGVAVGGAVVAVGGAGVGGLVVGSSDEPPQATATRGRIVIPTSSVFSRAIRMWVSLIVGKVTSRYAQHGRASLPGAYGRRPQVRMPCSC